MDAGGEVEKFQAQFMAVVSHHAAAEPHLIKVQIHLLTGVERQGVLCRDACAAAGEVLQMYGDLLPAVPQAAGHRAFDADPLCFPVYGLLPRHPDGGGQPRHVEKAPQKIEDKGIQIGPPRHQPVESMSPGEHGEAAQEDMGEHDKPLKGEVVDGGVLGGDVEPDLQVQ